MWPCTPRPRRLQYDRKADLFGEFVGVGIRPDQPVPRARQTRLAQYVLHLGLVPKPKGGRDIESFDARGLPNLGELYLEVFENADQPVHRTVSLLKRSDPGGQCGCIQRILHPGHVVEQTGITGRRGRVHEPEQPDVGKRLRRPSKTKAGLRGKGHREHDVAHSSVLKRTAGLGKRRNLCTL